jgi:hypothetical protein
VTIRRRTAPLARAAHPAVASPALPQPAGNGSVTRRDEAGIVVEPRARSAGLLISVYVDAEGGAPWHARLCAFDDTDAASVRVERVSDSAGLTAAVLRWLDQVTGHSAPSQAAAEVTEEGKSSPQD